MELGQYLNTKFFKLPRTSKRILISIMFERLNSCIKNNYSHLVLQAFQENLVSSPGVSFPPVHSTLCLPFPVTFSFPFGPFLVACVDGYNMLVVSSPA